MQNIWGCQIATIFSDAFFERSECRNQNHRGDFPCVEDRLGNVRWDEIMRIASTQSLYPIDKTAFAWGRGITYPQSIKRLEHFLTADNISAGTPNGRWAYPALRGLTYTNFGPGMSMGHSVCVRSKKGVKEALSVTIPLGEGIHRRMVYVELEEGAKLEDVTAEIKADPYFAHDETHVFAVASVDDVKDMGHGVNLVRKGVSGKTQNQRFEFNMSINNPALTAQVLVNVARASFRLQPGCYTMPEIPVIDMLPGTREEVVATLV